jgi:hypothetical protein
MDPGYFFVAHPEGGPRARTRAKRKAGYFFVAHSVYIYIYIYIYIVDGYLLLLYKLGPSHIKRDRDCDNIYVHSVPTSIINNCVKSECLIPVSQLSCSVTGHSVGVSLCTLYV